MSVLAITTSFTGRSWTSEPKERLEEGGLRDSTVTLTKPKLRGVFFFCRPSTPVRFNEPVQYTVKYRAPWARYLIGSLPRWLKRPFMVLHVSERIVEVPFVFASLRAPKGSRIVDLGCAESKLSLELANRGYKVLAADLRPYRFAHPNLRSLQGDFIAAPMMANSVDAVIAISTLEHIGLDWYGNGKRRTTDLAVVEKVRKILKPGGQLILTVPYGVKEQTEWYRVYDRRGLDGLLAGFEVEKTEFYCRVGSSAWEETSEQGAASIASPVETNCVALVAAVAKKDLAELGLPASNER